MPTGTVQPTRLGCNGLAFESVVNGAEGRNEPKEQCSVRLTGPATGRRLLLPAAQAEEPIVHFLCKCVSLVKPPIWQSPIRLHAAPTASLWAGVSAGRRREFRAMMAKHQKLFDWHYLQKMVFLLD